MSLTPKGPSVPTKYKNVHFDRAHLSIFTVKIHEILITLSHIILEEDPMVAYSISSSRQLLFK